MTDQILLDLQALFGIEEGAKMFKLQFPDPIVGYAKGSILTFGQLQDLPVGTIIHISYYDEDENLREDGFQPLEKHDELEWAAGAYPFPVEDLQPTDLLKDCDNSGWTFTISAAVPI